MADGDFHRNVDKFTLLFRFVLCYTLVHLTNRSTPDGEATNRERKHLSESHNTLYDEKTKTGFTVKFNDPFPKQFRTATFVYRSMVFKPLRLQMACQIGSNYNYSWFVVV